MGWEGATSPFLPCSYYHMVVDGWSQIFPRSSSQDWLTYTLVNRVSSIVLLMRGAGPVFPSTVTDKGECLLPGLLQVAVLLGGPSFPCLHHHVADEEVVLLYDSQIPRVSSPMCLSTGSTVLCCPNKTQGQFSRVLQLVGVGSVPLPATGSK